MGCSSVKAIRHPSRETFTDPTYTVEKFFFFFGLVEVGGEIPVDQVCLGKGADQIVIEHSALDTFAAVFTLGLYMPKSVRIWCSL